MQSVICVDNDCVIQTGESTSLPSVRKDSLHKRKRDELSPNGDEEEMVSIGPELLTILLKQVVIDYVQ